MAAPDTSSPAPGRPLGRVGRLGRAVQGFFVRLGLLFLAPRQALGDALAGRWPAARDATLLLALGTLCGYTPEVVRVVLAAWDLGVREGVNELSWALGRRLTPDLVTFLGIAALVVLPLRLLGRLGFDRALDLAAACWIPAFLLRMGGSVWRLQTGRPPARLFEGADYWAGVACSGALVVLCLFVVLRDGDD